MGLREREREWIRRRDGAPTLALSFERTAERHEESPAQLYKGGVFERSLVAAGAIDPAPEGGFATLSYAATRDVVRKLAAGFRALGVGADDRVALLSEPRMEWAQADLALLSAGAVVVPAFEDASTQRVANVLADADVAGAVVGTAADRDRVREGFGRGGLDPGFVVGLEAGTARRDDEYTLGELYRLGATRYDPDRYREWVRDREAGDLATLAYAGDPGGDLAGVRLTHGNVRANVDGTLARLAPREDRPDDAPTFGAGDRLLSHLPLSRVYERVAGQFVPFTAGASIAYAEGPETLVEDARAVGPTVLTSVPEVYRRLYERVREGSYDSLPRRRVFDWATDVAREYHREAAPGYGLRARHRLADRLVFDRVKAALGGEVEFLVSGGSTLPKDLVALYHGAGLPLIEGYGREEAGPVVSLNPPEHAKLGTVGPPLAEVEVGIDRSVVPEEAFGDAFGEFGELLVKGPSVTDGYWNRPDRTERATVGDGFVRTGDVVQRRPDGYLVFREHAGALLTLSTGKAVAPVPVERSLTDSPVIDRAMVVGDGRRYAAALLVPDVDRIRETAREEGVDLPGSDAELLDHERVLGLLEREVARVNGDLEPHERVRAFEPVLDEWTAEEGLLTPGGDLRRRAVREEYADRIEACYGATDDEGATPWELPGRPE